MANMKKYGPPLLLIGVLVLLSRWLLGVDVFSFWTWWLLAALLGLLGMPAAGRLFASFDDKGWFFSKILSIAVTGYAEWLLVTTKNLRFSSASCIGIVVACGVLSVGIFYWQSRKGIDCMPSGHLSLVLWEEVIFLGVFLIWTYLAGFNPAAHGTEKFMDYGFMEAMMRSDTLPARDLWYSEGVINYYYGGQYFAVFLTKLTGCRVEVTYNLMRTFVAGFAFVLPFSLVYQLSADRMRNDASLPHSGAFQKAVPALSGLTAGISVCIAGNMQYVIYRWVLPWIQKLRGEEASGYWFPDATRYIGHNPDRPDKTIHEFPCYSFVLGDLHAHVVNIIFVLLMAGLLYAWFQTVRRSRTDSIQDTDALNKGEELTTPRPLAEPHLLLAGFLLGLYRLNNYWDFIIYFVVASGTALWINLIEEKKHWLAAIGRTIGQALILFAAANLTSIPFSVLFESMVTGVAFAQYHSLFYQLMVLWGLPLALGGFFVISQVLKAHVKKEFSLPRLMNRMKTPDLFVILLFICASGLILIPELVYVRDIYEGSGNARANTMFKLTYQAYMMFGMVMGYVIWNTLAFKASRAARAFCTVGLVLLCLTFGYFGNCVNVWYGGWKDPGSRAGLNAVMFLHSEFSEDVGGIDWLKTNVPGTQVVLEANGDSYTDYCRVSAMTGLPTVLGWYVHEWLWREDPEDLNQKASDVERIYTSSNMELVRALLRNYEVSYIFVGEKEREKYADALNLEGLKSLGTVVYQDAYGTTCILKVNP